MQMKLVNIKGQQVEAFGLKDASTYADNLISLVRNMNISAAAAPQFSDLLLGLERIKNSIVLAANGLNLDAPPQKVADANDEPLPNGAQESDSEQATAVQ